MPRLSAMQICMVRAMQPRLMSAMHIRLKAMQARFIAMRSRLMRPMRICLLFAVQIRLLEGMRSAMQTRMIAMQTLRSAMQARLIAMQSLRSAMQTCQALNELHGLLQPRHLGERGRVQRQPRVGVRTECNRVGGVVCNETRLRYPEGGERWGTEGLNQGSGRTLGIVPLDGTRVNLRFAWHAGRACLAWCD